METIQLGKQSVLTEGSMNISFKFINAKKCREKCENFFFYRSNLLEETADLIPIRMKRVKIFINCDSPKISNDISK